jgi:hypothetical protein
MLLEIRFGLDTCTQLRLSHEVTASRICLIVVERATFSQMKVGRLSLCEHAGVK